MNSLSVRYPSAELKDLADMGAFIEDSAISLGGDTDPVSELQIAAREAITNVILHGYRGQPGLIVIVIERENNDIRLRLLDSALPFDPTSAPVPDVTLPLEHRPCGGMGIQMMRSFTDGLSYRWTTDGMNELIFTKRNVAAKTGEM